MIINTDAGRGPFFDSLIFLTDSVPQRPKLMSQTEEEDWKKKLYKLKKKKSRGYLQLRAFLNKLVQEKRTPCELCV